MQKASIKKKKNSLLEPLKKRVPKWRTDYKSIDKFKFVYHFLPHPEKKERSKFLSFKSFGLYIFLILIVMGLFRLLPSFAPGVLGYASDISIKDLLDNTNKYREEKGLGELVIDEKLSNAAYKKALDMFEHNYWAHVSPSGTEPWDFILAEDYDYVYAGENLAKNFSNSKDVVKAWMESPSHRDNLLNRNYKEIGFAVVNGTLDGYETTLVVQMFGQPRNLAAIPNKSDQEKILKQVSTQGATVVNKESTVNGLEVSVGKNDPTLDANNLVKYFSIGLAGFVLGLLVLDIWYSSKNGIFKFTGHTFAHVLAIFVTVLSIWFVLNPGLVL